MRNLSWLQNCNIVLSGCSTGIGREIALILSFKYNCKIFGIARNVSKLEKLKSELGEENFDYISADVSKKESWDEIVTILTEKNFAPDILINNAGVIHPFKKFRELTEQQITSTMSTNYYSLVLSVKALLPLLDKSPKRAIINISSASAYLPCPGASIYSSSKSASSAFSDVLREELIGEGFYVGSVMPGPVRTDLYSDHMATAKGQSGEKYVKDKFISNYGMSAMHAAQKIIRKVRRCKRRITIGFSSYLMDIFHRICPSFAVAILGRFFRVAPLITYKDMFKDEKIVKAQRKKEQKERKKEGKKG